MFWTYFVAISLLIHGQIEQLTFQDNTFISNINSYILILGAAAIPFGFIIYQVYYWMYWHAATPRIIFHKLMNANDRSSNILKDIRNHIEWDSIFCRSLENPDETAYRKGFFGMKDTNVMNQYQHNWALAQSIWYLTLRDEKYAPIANILEIRVQFLNDIYHSLGACIITLISAYLVYFFAYEVRLWLHDGFLSSRGMAAVINILMVVVMFSIFRKGRRDSFYALTTLMHDIITIAKPTMQEHKTTRTNNQ